MSMNEPDAGTGPSEQDRTPYLARDESPEDAADDVTDADGLQPALSPAEEVRLRRDLELELERFEQGIEG